MMDAAGFGMLMTYVSLIASVLAPGKSLAIHYLVGVQVSAVVSACFFTLAFVCSPSLALLFCCEELLLAG